MHTCGTKLSGCSKACIVYYLQDHSVLFLLQWDKTRRVGSTDTGTTVLDRLVCDGELTQVMSNHLSLRLS